MSDAKPPGLTSFIGREREISELERLLAARARLLTLTGPGGSGKTRLASAVAIEVVENFEDGVWWVELAPISDPDLVPQAVARVLNVPETPGRSLTENIIEDLRDLEILIVLDNCEHLVEACALLTDALGRSCPSLSILATSREALGAAGERSFPVPPLSSPQAKDLSAEELKGFEAVRLFVERASYRRPDFVLDTRSGRAVAEICRRLDGMPLAIELAAARTRVLSVEQISSRLEASFRLLKSESRTPTRMGGLRQKRRGEGSRDGRRGSWNVTTEGYTQIGLPANTLDLLRGATNAKPLIDLNGKDTRSLANQLNITAPGIGGQGGGEKVPLQTVRPLVPTGDDHDLQRPRSYAKRGELLPR